MTPWGGPVSRAPFGAGRRGLFEPPREAPLGRLEAVERVKDWMRERFALALADVIVVCEAAGTLPGTPPVETVVAFWDAQGTRHRFKVFKPVEALVEEDLPPAWMKGALALDDLDCPCC